MRTPEIYTTDMIQLWDTDKEGRDGITPARPERYGAHTFKRRIKIAYLVFTGKLDALEWDES